MLFLLLIVFIIILIIIFLEIEIDVKDLNINLPESKENIIKVKPNIKLKLYTFKKIKLLDLKIKKLKLKEEKTESKFKNFKFDKNFFSSIKYLKLDVNLLDLRIYLSMKEAATTALTVGVISTILSILLKNIITNLDKQKYIIIPIYKDKIFLNIEISGIFRVSLRNIIYIIFKFLLKRKAKIKK